MKNRKNKRGGSIKTEEVMKAYLKSQGVTPQQIGMEEKDEEYFDEGAFDEEKETGESFFNLEGLVDKIDYENEKLLLKKAGIKVFDVEELGLCYGVLRHLGIEPSIAYSIIKTDKEKELEKIQPPPMIGRLNSKTAADKDYYSPEEVDRLSEEDLKDPRVLQTVMNSMTKWKR